MTEGEHTLTFRAGFQDLVATITLQASVKSRFDFTIAKEVKEQQQNHTVAKAA